VALVAFGRHFVLTFNVSDSLPGTVFLVRKGNPAGLSDLVAFRYAGSGLIITHISDCLILKETLNKSPEW
jgi:hypothetical protein